MGGANKAPSNTSQLILALQDAKHQPVGQGEVESLKPATDCPKGHRHRPRWHSAHPHLLSTRGKGGEQLPGRAKTRMNDANRSPRLKHQDTQQISALCLQKCFYCKSQKASNLQTTSTTRPQKHSLVQPTNPNPNQGLKARKHTHSTNQAIPYDLATSTTEIKTHNKLTENVVQW